MPICGNKPHARGSSCVGKFVNPPGLFSGRLRVVIGVSANLVCSVPAVGLWLVFEASSHIIFSCRGPGPSCRCSRWKLDMS